MNYPTPRAHAILLAWICMAPLLLATGPASSHAAAYYGIATITSPMDMAEIDLAFELDVYGTSILNDTSYILLDKTMLYPAVPPQINGIDVGPRVTGFLSATAFNLVTDDFSSKVSDVVVTRQIILDQATVTNEGNSITGKYTESVSGLLPYGQDVVIRGDFILMRPTVPAESIIEDSDKNGCLDLAEIRAGGSDPKAMEFGDASAALTIYNSGGAKGTICSPADQNTRDAVQEFYNSQN